MTAPGYFQNRYVETELIGRFVAGAGARLLAVVGRGGVGKTAMVCRLLKALEGGRLPDEGGALEVDGIVYLTPVGAHQVSFEKLFADLCRLLPEDTASRLGERYRDGQSPRELMVALLDEFPSGRVVVLLDNFEDFIDPKSLAITDASLEEALGALLTAPDHAVKVILTTRLAPFALLVHAPGRADRLDLDEGLKSPYAESILRERDPSGVLGLRDAPEELLDRARERTRGYPRALEALAAILAADRNATLVEVLDDASQALPAQVVEMLVGEAFERLDLLAQQVMQALAVYSVPVPPVAVDFLLQRFRTAVDTAPVLSRLVNMNFVRRDAGLYYLHQVDREYALGRLNVGEHSDLLHLDPIPFSQHALRDLAASYFEQTRTTRGSWRALEDLTPQLTEFELRCENQDYDAAASVLLEVTSSHLILWGHYQLCASLQRRVSNEVTEDQIRARILSNLGVCHQQMGDLPGAIIQFEQALVIMRNIRDREGEASVLCNLGISHRRLCDFSRAVTHYEQALVIVRNIPDRTGEAGVLGNLGICQMQRGDFRQGVTLFEQALAISREIQDQNSEATALGNLGEAQLLLGDVDQAETLLNRALMLHRSTGDRYGEATALDGLGQAYCDRQDWHSAIRLFGEAIRIADETGLAQTQSETRLNLVTVLLLSGDNSQALAAAESAAEYDYPPTRAQTQLLAGITYLISGRDADARRAFTTSVEKADELLHRLPSDYQALNTKGLALSGLVAAEDDRLQLEAAESLQIARQTVDAAGITARTLRLFDLIDAADPATDLRTIRSAISG